MTSKYKTICRLRAPLVVKLFEKDLTKAESIELQHYNNELELMDNAALAPDLKRLEQELKAKHKLLGEITDILVGVKLCLNRTLKPYLN